MLTFSCMLCHSPAETSQVPFAQLPPAPPTLGPKLATKPHIDPSYGRQISLKAPDEDGTQMRAIRAHLRKHPKVKYVWFECAREDRIDALK